MTIKGKSKIAATWDQVEVDLKDKAPGSENTVRLCRLIYYMGANAGVAAATEVMDAMASGDPIAAMMESLKIRDELAVAIREAKHAAGVAVRTATATQP